jgi:predicted SprT family Zn-dependent metalloprotease
MNLYLARDMARLLMRQHGLTDWTFRFDHARRRFGSCRPRERVITLSKYLTFLNGDAEVRDTILHEIAHALAPGDGHGRKWQATCVRIGAKPSRCYTDDEVTSPPRRPAAYQIGCGKCGWWADRHRLTRRKLVCRACRSPVVYREKPTRPEAAPTAVVIGPGSDGNKASPLPASANV